MAQNREYIVWGLKFSSHYNDKSKDVKFFNMMALPTPAMEYLTEDGRVLTRKDEEKLHDFQQETAQKYFSIEICGIGDSTCQIDSELWVTKITLNPDYEKFTIYDLIDAYNNGDVESIKHKYTAEKLFAFGFCFFSTTDSDKITFKPEKEVSRIWAIKVQAHDTWGHNVSRYIHSCTLSDFSAEQVLNAVAELVVFDTDAGIGEPTDSSQEEVLEGTATLQLIEVEGNHPDEMMIVDLINAEVADYVVLDTMGKYPFKIYSEEGIMIND